MCESGGRSPLSFETLTAQRAKPVERTGIIIMKIKQDRDKERNKVKLYIKNYKKNKSCKECGYKEHTEILQFHHKNGGNKLKNISSLIRMRVTINKLKEEINKCILLCPNCHFWLHCE